MAQVADRRRARRRSGFFRELTDSLCEYVRYRIKWQSGGSDDGLRRDGETLAEFYERFGKSDEVPDEPEVPECAAHVLGWFFDLSNRRASAFSGAGPITFADIGAWRDLTGTIVEPFEVRMILDMDSAFRSAVNEAHSKAAKANEEPIPNGMFGK